jgi:UDP:flavonoid glycosyltransferase YjiC (YdhE family)
MKNIGIICPEISGHLNPMTTLGRELHRRGHRVAVIASVEAERKATSAGLGFLPIALETRPALCASSTMAIRPSRLTVRES